MLHYYLLNNICFLNDDRTSTFSFLYSWNFQLVGLVLIHVLLMSTPGLEKVICLRVATWGVAGPCGPRALYWAAALCPSIVANLPYFCIISALPSSFLSNIRAMPGPKCKLFFCGWLPLWMLTVPKLSCHFFENSLQPKTNNISQFVYPLCPYFLVEEELTRCRWPIFKLR